MDHVILHLHRPFLSLSLIAAVKIYDTKKKTTLSGSETFSVLYKPLSPISFLISLSLSLLLRRSETPIHRPRIWYFLSSLSLDLIAYVPLVS